MIFKEHYISKKVWPHSEQIISIDFKYFDSKEIIKKRD